MPSSAVICEPSPVGARRPSRALMSSYKAFDISRNVPAHLSRDYWSMTVNWR